MTSTFVQRRAFLAGGASPPRCARDTIADRGGPKRACPSASATSR